MTDLPLKACIGIWSVGAGLWWIDFIMLGAVYRFALAVFMTIVAALLIAVLRDDA